MLREMVITASPMIVTEISVSTGETPGFTGGVRVPGRRAAAGSPSRAASPEPPLFPSPSSVAFVRASPLLEGDIGLTRCFRAFRPPFSLADTPRRPVKTGLEGDKDDGKPNACERDCEAGRPAALRRAPRQAGTTLIELLVTVTIMGIAMTALMATLCATIANSASTAIRHTPTPMSRFAAKLPRTPVHQLRHIRYIRSGTTSGAGGRRHSVLGVECWDALDAFDQNFPRT